MNNNKIQLKVEHFENSKTVSNFCLMYTGNHIEKERETERERQQKRGGTCGRRSGENVLNENPQRRSTQRIK